MKIVVTEPYLMAAEVRDALAALGEVSYGPFSSEDLAEQMADCEVLMVRLGRYIGETLLIAAPKLRFVVSATTALDHIDLKAVSARNVRVISLRDCPSAIQDVTATAEHSWGLLLSLCRNLVRATQHVANGGWDRNIFWGTQLRGKRLGIIGHGRIGARVASYGEAFGMQVIAFDVDPDRIRAPAERRDLDELVSTSDVISVHISAVPQNYRFIGRTLIERMKPGAFFINTARGSVVDEEALAAAVASGRLGGAAVDVLGGEEHGQIEGNPLPRWRQGRPQCDRYAACRRGDH